MDQRPLGRGADRPDRYRNRSATASRGGPVDSWAWRASGDRSPRAVSSQRPDSRSLVVVRGQRKRRAIVDERVSLISTGDYLRELEAAGLIQSTDYILDRAAARGRNVEKQRKPGEDATTRGRFRDQLLQRRDASNMER